MSQAKWTLGLADKGHTYLCTAVHLQEPDAWNVLLEVDGEYINALSTDDPTSLSLQMIADAQLKMEEAPIQRNPKAPTIEQLLHLASAG